MCASNAIKVLFNAFVAIYNIDTMKAIHIVCTYIVIISFNANIYCMSIDIPYRSEIINVSKSPFWCLKIAKYVSTPRYFWIQQENAK